MDKIRAGDFLDKAEKLLAWGGMYLEEMRNYGRHAELDDVERVFVSILLTLDSVHQALVDAAKKLDLDQWRDQLNQLRENDILLRYLWKARNSETHDALVKWRPSMKHIEMRVIDPSRTAKIADPRMIGQQASIARLFCYLFDARNEAELIEVLKENPKPSLEKQAEAGVELLHSLDSLSLDSFSLGRGNGVQTIDAPTSHLGKMLPPSADQAVLHGLEFYKSKLNELKNAKIVAP